FCFEVRTVNSELRCVLSSDGVGVSVSDTGQKISARMQRSTSTLKPRSQKKMHFHVFLFFLCFGTVSAPLLFCYIFQYTSGKKLVPLMARMKIILRKQFFIPAFE